MNHTEFDECAEDYEAQLNQGLSCSGESREFFARGRLVWLKQCLDAIGFRPTSVLDYGCGTGLATPLFIELLGARSVVGIDVSAKSLEVARRTYGHLASGFHLPSDDEPTGQIDLAFCNGVFHHIPPKDRSEAVSYILRCLRPGGIFAFWENNPWNPGTRFIMSRVPFDRDAIMLSAPEARRLVRRAGFEVVRTDSCFFFPNALKALRWIEPFLAKLPFGGQYQVLCCNKRIELQPRFRTGQLQGSSSRPSR
jgi:SAM-dependent methyltransferase